METNKLYEKLGIAREVVNTLDSKGWTETIRVILNSMIDQIDGGETANGRKGYGMIHNATTEKETYELIGRKKGLVDLYNRIYDHIHAIPRIKDEIKRVEEASSRIAEPYTNSIYGESDEST